MWKFLLTDLAIKLDLCFIFAIIRIIVLLALNSLSVDYAYCRAGLVEKFDQCFCSSLSFRLF